jgi:diacylglycerol kinase
MNERPTSPLRWNQKFLCAFRGLRVGSRGQTSFFVHIPTACFVLAAAAQFRVTTVEWCILVLCIALVFTTELLNTAIETLARAITSEYDPRIRDALDIGAAAVLVSCIGSGVIGLLILGFRLGVALGWWPLPAYTVY